eukprot:CAMPEP_0117508552 /NCGR_PEP_ID=MMETSP0784-20121206/27011_1 /TAXON_ID=39447 /ORGANISM="" /LENGTH=213 /DNA_ID=CAMNT_0005304117 /DNA_START=9 /DNA_END=649 /DNA_ORIENTATION=+
MFTCGCGRRASRGDCGAQDWELLLDVTKPCGFDGGECGSKRTVTASSGDGATAQCPLSYPERFYACVAVAEGLMPAEDDVDLTRAAKATDAPLSSHEKRLLLYALRRQAEQGPCKDTMPWPWDVIAHAKWSAWSGLGDMRNYEAMRLYCRAVEEEVPDWWLAHDDCAHGGPFSADGNRKALPPPLVEDINVEAERFLHGYLVLLIHRGAEPPV